MINKKSSVNKNISLPHTSSSRSRKPDGFLYHKMRAVICEAIPDYRTSYPHPRKNFCDRFVSTCATIKENLTLKNLVTVLKYTGAVLSSLIVFAAINGAAFAIVFGFFSIGIPAVSMIVFILFFPFMATSIALSLDGSLNAFAVWFPISKNPEKEINTENERPLKDIRNLAHCLTSEGDPDMSTLTQRIVKVQDNSSLSGTDDYDDIRNNLMLYLKAHPTLIHPLIDHASAQDWQTVMKMRKNIKEPKNISLTQIKKYYELMNTWDKVYKKIDCKNDDIRTELVNAVLSNLAKLPRTYKIYPSVINLWDETLKLYKLKKDLLKRDTIIATTTDKPTEILVYHHYKISELADYLEHISYSLNLVNLYDNQTEFSELQRKTIAQAKEILSNLPSQLFELHPKYKNDTRLTFLNV